MKTKKRLKREEALFLGLEIKESTERNKNPKYNLEEYQVQLLEGYRLKVKERKFVEVQRKLDKDGEIISSVEKLQSEPIDVPKGFEIVKVSTSKTTGQQWIQYKPKEAPDKEDIDFDSIVKKHLQAPIKHKKVQIKQDNLFDRLVFTDTHIGMNPNENGFSLYGGVWDEKELKSRLENMIDHVLENQKSDTIYIDDLGDFMDGWDAKTVRREHTLPQNMDNEQAFDLGVYFKTYLVDCLSSHFNKIVFHNVVNDNHAGSFGYVVSSAFKSISQAKHSNVSVNIFRRFIDHYIVCNHAFILCHGKDTKNLKFGFKPVLDANQADKIINYIDRYDLRIKKLNIEFSKGDSHQKIFDESGNDLFDYYSYPAFSPSSEWVQSNYKCGFSGFEFFNYKESGKKIHNPFKFEWKIK